MKVWKTMLAAALAAASLLGLTACGGGITNDATVYVQGLLDANYKGQISQEYIDVVEDMTQEQAEADHANNLEIEGDYLLTYLAVEMPTDAVTQRAQELVDEIYSHAQYTVADAEQLSGGDIVVEVTISPIEIMPQITGEFMQETWDAVLSENGITTQEQLDAQFQAMDEQYAMALMDEVERLIPELTYGTDQVVMLQLKEEDGYYSLVDSGLQKLDEIMIDYYGAYV